MPTSNIRPRGDSSFHISPSKELTLTEGLIHAPDGRPAFVQRWSRYSVSSHPHSTGTWGRSSPERPNSSMISPSRPTTISPGSSAGSSNMMGTGGVRTVTSTVMAGSSCSSRSGKRGSWQADAAPRLMASPNGMTGIGMPMQPRRSPEGWLERVTKAPETSENLSSPGIGGISVPLTSASTEARAKRTASPPNKSLTRALEDIVGNA